MTEKLKNKVHIPIGHYTLGERRDQCGCSPTSSGGKDQPPGPPIRSLAGLPTPLTPPEALIRRLELNTLATTYR